MATLKLYNLARMSTATTGTGTITLGSAVSGFLTFALAGVQDGETVRYSIKDGSNSEIGYGVDTSSGTTLTRNVLKSTNSDAAINLSGSAEVMITPAAEDLAPRLGVGLHNGKITESHSGNAATFHLKTIAGNDPSINDPVLAVFPDGSLLAITAALSVTINSTATMGFSSGVNGRLWVAVINDGGTARLGVRNCRNGIIIDGFPASGVLTSTTIGTGADSAAVTYTDSGVSAKPFVLAAFADYDSGLATAGTWDASPTRIVQFGPGIHKPGDLVQKQRKHYATIATGTTTVPLDDTIPQNTEGDQYMDITVTPQAVQNLLVVHAEPLLNATGSGQVHTTSIFQDSTANALASKYSSTELSVGPVVVEHTMIAGTLSATTFKMRSGGFTAGTTTFNGLGGAQKYGGVANSFFSVEEFMA